MQNVCKHVEVLLQVHASRVCLIRVFFVYFHHQLRTIYTRRQGARAYMYVRVTLSVFGGGAKHRGVTVRRSTPFTCAYMLLHSRKNGMSLKSAKIDRLYVMAAQALPLGRKPPHG